VLVEDNEGAVDESHGLVEKHDLPPKVKPGDQPPKVAPGD